jgi:hypothetical protein
MSAPSRLFFVALPPVGSSGNRLVQYGYFFSEGRIEPLPGEISLAASSAALAPGLYQLPAGFFGRFRSWPPFEAPWSVDRLREVIEPL